MELKDLKLNSNLNANLESIGFTQLTSVQDQAVPPALNGKDLLVLSPTGTGKTGAYSIPLLNKLFNTSSNGLILVPTRDLALQVYNFLVSLTKNSKITPILLIGGVSLQPQFKQLKNHPRLIIGTPGRVLHHSKLDLLPAIDFLVLDEVDRMLDLGFKKDLHLIVSKLTLKPQTLLFSATLPKALIPLTGFYLKDPLTLDLSVTNRIALTITEKCFYPKTKIQKQNYLLDALKTHPGTKIIFTNRKCDTVALSKFLLTHNLSNFAFNGDVSQNKRATILKKFLKKQFEILVCTDLASRGLDIKDLSCVINYELPICAHDYMHRVGRTGRNGALGIAINLITPQDMHAWTLIENYKKTNESTEYVKKDRVNFARKNKTSFKNYKTFKFLKPRN